MTVSPTATCVLNADGDFTSRAPSGAGAGTGADDISIAKRARRGRAVSWGQAAGRSCSAGYSDGRRWWAEAMAEARYVPPHAAVRHALRTR